MKRSDKWPKIVERNYSSGKGGFMVAAMIRGERIRRTFATRAEAETFAQQVRIQRQNIAELTLTPSLRAEAVRCVEKLAPHDVSLSQAVDYYLEHVVTFRESPTVSETIGRLLADAEKAGRRERTLIELRQRLGAFARRFGDRQIATISLEELKGWLDDPTLAPRSRINYATKVSQLYNYAIRHGWAQSNLVDRVPRPSIEDKEPGIFTVEHATELLRRAPEFDLLPYVAIGLFAGLRTAELQGLDWSSVKLSERSIIVGAAIAKKRSRRVVEIHPTLEAWLRPWVAPRGALIPAVNLRHRLEALAKTVGEWPHNALRHSFASYHLALFGDPIKTAGQMGHLRPDVIQSHYRALVTKGEAEKYWNILPNQSGKRRR